MSPELAARLLAGGRMAFGGALLAAPRQVARSWLGEDYAGRPAVRSLARSLGVRDLVLGMIALHTVDHPDVGPRWLATCATVDAVDLLATLGARADLPRTGVIGTALVAGGAAGAGFYLSRAIS